MRAELTGDDAGLAKLRARLEALAKSAQGDAVRAMSAQVSELVADGFKTGQSPSGVPWRPLSRARPRSRRSGKPLVSTGRLRASVTARPRVFADGFSVTAMPVYAATHQYGRGQIPARPFLPLPDLDESWAQRLRDAAAAAVAALISS